MGFIWGTRHLPYSLYLFPFRFIVKAIDCGDHVAVFVFLPGNVTFGVASDCGDAGGIVQVDFLAREKTVDDEILRVAGIFPVATENHLTV